MRWRTAERPRPPRACHVSQSRVRTVTPDVRGIVVMAFGVSVRRSAVRRRDGGASRDAHDDTKDHGGRGHGRCHGQGHSRDVGSRHTRARSLTSLACPVVVTVFGVGVQRSAVPRRNRRRPRTRAPQRTCVSGARHSGRARLGFAVGAYAIALSAGGSSTGGCANSKRWSGAHLRTLI